MKAKPDGPRFRNLYTYGVVSMLAATPFCGCGGSTGIVATGENECMVSRTDIGDTWSSGGKVLAELCREANDYCAEKGMVVESISEEPAPGQTFVI